MAGGPGLGRHGTPSRVTVKDVALRARCSPATISRALNNHASVAKATRARVVRAAAALGYYPDAVAKSLRVKRTFSVGLVVRDIGNPNFSVLCAAVASAASAHAYTVFMCSSSWSADAERDIFRAMIERRFDGIVLLLADEEQSDIRMLVDVGIPLVLVESQSPPGVGIDSVMSDNFGGAFEAGQYLAGLGHRKIAVLAGSQRVVPGRDRLRGFAEACAEAGVALPPSRVSIGAFSEDHGYHGTLALMTRDDPPTALFCSSNQLLHGALVALSECGKRIAHDVSVVSFDESIAATMHVPKITVVARDVAAIGAQAIDLLLRRMGARRAGAPDTAVVATKLLIRDSCRSLERAR